MDDESAAAFHSSRDEWERRFILIPRIGLKVSRHGMRQRMIWPGYYMVRWSRTYRRNVYRRR
ncbi:MAG TPA: hypothetical protein PKD99_03960 [Sphingopyxis sp.]|nr:hypothetical protein [Sphingopyxis sp.]HMP44238.1 hypothetical protein [Sphingopyxis sp.]HMQ19177.1 hypothetical protein [Sphingopyxis sp.]